MTRFSRALLAAGLAAATLTLSACGEQEVYGKLKERQANEMIAALRNANISARKEGAGEGEWSVVVSPDQFSRAVEVLKANGLPREEFQSLGDVFAKKGFVSSPTEERARLIYGLSQELSQTVSSIDGVAEARVHLAIPQTDPLSKETRPSSASVFVKYRPGFDVRSQTGAIKSLVTNAIEGLEYDKVSVVMVASQTAPAAPEMTVARFDTPLTRGLLVLVALAWPIWLLLKRRRRRPAAGVPAKAEHGG